MGPKEALIIDKNLNVVADYVKKVSSTERGFMYEAFESENLYSPEMVHFTKSEVENRINEIKESVLKLVDDNVAEDIIGGIEVSIESAFNYQEFRYCDECGKIINVCLLEDGVCEECNSSHFDPYEEY